MNTQEQKKLLEVVVNRLEKKKIPSEVEGQNCAHCGKEVTYCECQSVNKGLDIAIDEVKNYISFLGE